MFATADLPANTNPHSNNGFIDDQRTDYVYVKPAPPLEERGSSFSRHVLDTILSDPKSKAKGTIEAREIEQREQYIIGHSGDASISKISEHEPVDNIEAFATEDKIDQFRKFYQKFVVKSLTGDLSAEERSEMNMAKYFIVRYEVAVDRHIRQAARKAIDEKRNLAHEFRKFLSAIL